MALGGWQAFPSLPEGAMLTCKSRGVLKKKKERKGSQWYLMRNVGAEAVHTSASENAKHQGGHDLCLHISFHKLKLNQRILILYYHHKIEFLSMSTKQSKELSCNIEACLNSHLPRFPAY